MNPQGATSAGRLETAIMAAAVFLLTANFPTEWFVVREQGELDAGGDLFVSLTFLGIAGSLGLAMNGRWKAFFTIVRREPLLPALLLWAMMSTLWSEDVAFSIRRGIILMITTYLGVHFVMRFSQFTILRMLATTFAIVAFINLIWILAFPEFSGPARGQSPDNVFGFDARLTGIYDNANTLGRATALGVFTMVAALRLDRRRRVFYLCGIVAGAVALSLSQSQTSFVVAILTSCLLVVFLVFRARRQLFGAVFISVGLSTVVSVVLVLSNLELVTNALGRDVTLSGRVPLWESLIPVIPERLLTGWGYAGYWNGWGSPSHEIWNLHGWRPPHGHQQYLDIALTMGVVGLGIFVAMMLRTFVRSTRYIRDVRGSFGLWPLVYCCFYQLNSMTEAGLIGRDITWFLLSGTVVLVSGHQRVPIVDAPAPVAQELVPARV